MTRYFTKVSDVLLPGIRKGDRMPSCLRLVRELDRGDGWTMVEFEDDEAPADMEGCEVSPVLSSTAGRDTEHGPLNPRVVWISERVVESRPDNGATP